MLVNLLSNAVKYNRPGGQRRVSWQRRDDAATCASPTRHRHGAGQARAPVRAVQPPRRRELEDRGHRHRPGAVAPPGRADGAASCGSTARSARAPAPRWRWRLRRRAARASSAAPRRPSQHGSLDESLRVLYAEDNEVNVEMVRQVVKLRPSVALDVAESGALALEMARRDPPDLMLVDMNLGDMTGIELARALHADPRDLGHPPGRPVGRRAARADRRRACHGIRGLPDQADQLPRSARCAGRTASHANRSVSGNAVRTVSRIPVHNEDHEGSRDDAGVSSHR